MITRADILMLGIASGVSGGIIGGLMLGIGMAMMLGGVHMGLVLMCIGGPASAVVGWVMARKLAKKLPG